MHEVSSLWKDCEFFHWPSLLNSDTLAYVKCIVGYISERNSPTNMISHASTKSFMITFASKLRVRASTSNIDVVIVDPDFINSRIAKAIGANTAKHGGPQLMAALMKDALEMGGVGVVNLPISHSVKVYALRGKFKISPLRFPWRLTLVSF